MGKQQSKPEPKSVEVTNNGNMESERGGFHFIEIHLPTVNAGIVTLVILAALGVAGWFLARWCRRRMRRFEAKELRRARERDVELGRTRPSAPSVPPSEGHECRALVPYVPPSSPPRQAAGGKEIADLLRAAGWVSRRPPPPPPSPQGSRSSALADVLAAALRERREEDALGGDGRSQRRAYEI